MKGYTLNNNNLDRIKKEYNNEYGLNYYENNGYDDYNRFFTTKNNLNAHNKILVKK